MVSRLTERTICRRSASSATRAMVHRARPSGGGPHTIAMSAAVCALSRSLERRRRGSSLRACSIPPSRKRLATRRTSRRYVPVASAACVIVQPLSSRRRAWMRRTTSMPSGPSLSRRRSACWSSWLSWSPLNLALGCFRSSLTPAQTHEPGETDRQNRGAALAALSLRMSKYSASLPATCPRPRSSRANEVAVLPRSSCALPHLPRPQAPDLRHPAPTRRLARRRARLDAACRAPRRRPLLRREFKAGARSARSYRLKPLTCATSPTVEGQYGAQVVDF